MHKATSFINRLRLLLSCFLLFSFLSTSLQLPTHFDSKVSVLLSRKIKGAPQSDSEVPMQEIEKELEEKSKDGLFLYTLASFLDVLRSEDAASIAPFSNQTSTGKFLHVPLYISKRSLII